MFGGMNWNWIYSAPMTSIFRKALSRLILKRIRTKFNIIYILLTQILAVLSIDADANIPVLASEELISRIASLWAMIGGHESSIPRVWLCPDARKPCWTTVETFEVVSLYAFFNFEKWDFDLGIPELKMWSGLWNRPQLNAHSDWWNSIQSNESI